MSEPEKDQIQLAEAVKDLAVAMLKSGGEIKAPASPPPGVVALEDCSPSSDSSPLTFNNNDDTPSPEPSISGHRKRRTAGAVEATERLQDVCTELASTHLETPKRARTGSNADEDEWQVVKEGKEDVMSLASASTIDFGSDCESEEEEEASDSPNLDTRRRFDMTLLKQYIQTGSVALDQVKGKDVILVVGKTGTGKSSLIQGLAGKTFRPTFHNVLYNGETIQEKVFEADDPLPDFEIGHDKCSKTKAIQSFEQELTNKPGQSILYLDTPGFEDTDGHEMDVATSVMLNQVAKTCKSMRFCILIHYASLKEDRGGAIRSILKFTRNWVKDFVQEKQSFVFLFTHTNQFMFTPHEPYTMASAKENLTKEISKILKETEEEDSKKVLKFMRICLKQGIPLVDVLHPLKTDFPELRNILETKVKTAKNPTLAQNCGLTTSSGLMLEAGIQDLKRTLGHHLAEDKPDTNTINEIRETLRYVACHIDVTQIKDAVQSCEARVDRHCLSLQDQIDNEVQRGTDATSAFGAQNARHLDLTVRQLLDLNTALTEDHFLTRLQREVAGHYQQTLLEQQSCGDYRNVALKLDKLSAWKEVFPTVFDGLYTSIYQRFEADIISHMGTVRDLNPLSLKKATGQEKDLLFQSLAMLDSVTKSAEALSRHGLPSKDAAQEFSSAEYKISSVIESWNREEKDMMDVDNLDEASMMSLASRAKCLDDLLMRFEEASICADLLVSIQSALSGLEDRVVGQCEETAAELNQLPVPYQIEGLQKLQLLEVAKTSFQGIRMGRRWKEIQFCRSNVVSTIRSLVSVKSKEMDDTVANLQAHGVVDGKKEGMALSSYDSCQVFDECFDEADRFVKNCAIKYWRAYNGRIDLVSKDVKKMFDSLHETPADRIKVLAGLHELLQEAEQIVEFLAITSSDSRKDEVKSLVADLLNRYKSTLSQRTTASLTQWKAAVKQSAEVKEINRITREIDTLLGELEGLVQLDPSSTEARRLSTEIADTLGAFKAKVEAIDTCDKIDYGQLANLLECVQSCGAWPRTKKHLPSLSVLKQSVTSIVSKHAQKIEDMVKCSSQWDGMDAELESFKLATKVDGFIGGQAGSRLSPLLALREQKEAAVDDRLEEWLAKEDFKGIGELLSPLAESQDQLKRQKFDRHQRRICTSLQAQIEGAERCLSFSVSSEEAREVAETIAKLEDVQEEIGYHLKAHMDVSNEISKLKRRANDELLNLLDQLQEATERADFVKIGGLCAQSDVFKKNLERYISNSSRKKLNQGVTLANRKIDSVPSYVDKFVNSYFADGDELIGTFSALERCVGDPSLGDLAALYRQTKRETTEKTNEVLRQLDDIINETNCFGQGVGVLKTLLRALERGLKNHLNVDDLAFNCEEKVAVWQAEQKAHDKEMDFGGEDAKRKLKAWSDKLDKLKSPGILQRGRAFFSGESSESLYDRERQKLSKKVKEVLTDANAALNSRDFKQLQECIGILQSIADFVPNHIRSARKEAEAVKQRTVQAFLHLADQMKGHLAEGRLHQTEACFVDFKGFLLHVPHVLNQSSAVKEFELVNQLVYEALSKQTQEVTSWATLEADSFDFLALKSRVERARSFGGFVADQFVLLREELQENKAKCQWLDKISDLCHENFSEGRDFKLLKYCALLGVVPSASPQEIKRRYRLKAKEVHPDKRKSDDMDVDINAEFREVKEAQDILLSAAEARERSQARPFDAVLRQVGQWLREKAREYLREQRYGAIEGLLFKLPSLTDLDNLATPPLETQKVCQAVKEVVKSHVSKVKVEVDTSWSERKYRQLNDCIGDLKMMEDHFKSFTEVFPTAWNNGILHTIESRIDTLAEKARKYVSDRKNAADHQDDFKRCFLEMGSVLVELPTLKDYTKRAMCDVLEASLKNEWGYSFLFELGLSMQRGDGDQTEDEARVAHILLAEFSHFKEVMTMAWNTETTQKPVEDTVNDIISQDILSHKEFAVDRKRLLESFESFESTYKALLGEYIRPNADLAELVERTQRICHSMTPVPCDGGWSSEVKQKLPGVLAGVFAYFTVTKSGDSYNRMEESGAARELGDKLLFKPHNIQILTILQMFGCGSRSGSDLESQLLQIRTGEGKSMILGAAATLLGLLGHSCWVVCYSDYLSSRDFRLFADVFRAFDLCSLVKYSTITAFSEDKTQAKGDIRGLTGSLLHNQLAPAGSAPPRRSARLSRNPSEAAIIDESADAGLSQSNQSGIYQRTRSSRLNEGTAVTRQQKPSTAGKQKEDILLIDEVDVMFGDNFYGKSYDMVAEIREPEVADILKAVWASYKKGGRRKRLGDMKQLSSYKSLVKKLRGFEYMVDNEIALMLDQVKRVDDEPYYLSNDHIGYKVMDSVSYNVTYGYRTVFAYLKEADRGKLQAERTTLQRVLCMPISCGQFSYANINPTRILGVSGTLEALGPHERNVLANYGIGKLLFMPSVYGKSNFHFEKNELCIEAGESDHFHRLGSEIKKVTKQNRACIVLFQNAAKMKAFEDSPFYRKLGRQKAKLTENMDPEAKDFVIKKAATSGQLTICPAVFGRGTDFFCKDQKVLNNGGVHIIQTFLSAEKSEEIQIQGRTARQGKVGTYQMVLLDSDLKDFGLNPADKERVPKSGWYDWLSSARDKRYGEHCKKMEENLAEATVRDNTTHQYLDALLSANQAKGATLFKEIYMGMKKRPMPSKVEIDLALLVDVTGSMGPYLGALKKTISSLLTGRSSLQRKLQASYPDIEFKLRIATLAYRDIDDEEGQFLESCRHFSSRATETLSFLEKATANPCGGFDLAEDHLGAIDRCLQWRDWSSSVRFIMLFTDAPGHGMVPATCAKVANADSYAVRHPMGLTMESIVDELMSKEVDLCFCSFNPIATAPTEERLAALYLKHQDNTEARELTAISMVPKDRCQQENQQLYGGYGSHIIFVLDQSGSMGNDWAGVVAAYKNYIHRRMQNQSQSDLVSVVQFDDYSQVTVQSQSIGSVPTTLPYSGGGTRYSPAATDARKLALASPSTHAPVVVFMSDGLVYDNDAAYSANVFSTLNQEIQSQRGHDLELHVIAFGAGLDSRQLQQIARTSPKGRVYTSSNTAELSNIFVDIAQSQEVGKVLEAEVGRRISDAVSDKLSMEYLG